MRIKESRIRQIIKEEASRVIREASDDLPGPKFPPGSVKRPGLGAFGNFEPPEGWDDEEDYEDEEGGEGPRGWHGRGLFGEEDFLDSGNPELDSAWGEWVSCTDRVLGMLDSMGTHEFPQEDDPRSKISVSRMMRDYIENR